jgi:hypothetical protein
MRRPVLAGAGICTLIVLGLSSPVSAQHVHDAPADTASAPGMDMSHDMEGMDMSGMDMSGMQASMSGFYGPYPMTREASGTSWQPDAAEHTGLHAMRGAWMLMLHGHVNLVFDDQGSARGDQKVYSDNMAMGMAHRPLGPGTFGLRTMFSLEPATIGKEGYPLLLQTGETADGSTPLIDRQHPHDLFMELAGTYSVASGNRSLFLYAGLPGEPALGPPAFMHRFSGMDIPLAPITHHWLDSTHITYGVLTAGAVVDHVKVEASAFRGREPDENRWNIETPKLDSHSFRLSVNPGSHVALQVSYGRLTSPEQLEPDVDQDRTTASAMYDGSWSGGHWEATLAWGQTQNRPGHTLDAFASEAAASVGAAHTFMARAERVEKDELFTAPDPRAGQIFDVGELSAGYRFDVLRRDHWVVGIGALGTLSFVPEELQDAYGSTPVSGALFAHVGLR